MSNGGPAFPCEIDEKYYCMGNKTRKVSVTGLTKLDYFAAKAMQSVIATPEEFKVSGANQIARMAYEMAEAMLKESERRNAQG